jgi:DNA-binding MarR family transcriptional regulator
MSRVVRGLEEQGLATRRTNPEDRRSMTLRVTRRGRTLLERARRARITTLSSRLARLSSTEKRTLDQAAKILAELGAPPE